MINIIFSGSDKSCHPIDAKNYAEEISCPIR